MKKLIVFAGILMLIIAGCASMDLRVDTLRSDSNYGKTKPTIPFEEFRYFTGEPGRDFVELAQIIVQETPQVVLPRDTDEMISHMCKTAWKNGADAVINVVVSTTQVPGYTRTTPVVKGTAIKYKN